MATKKAAKTVRKSDCEEALLLAKALLEQLNTQETWTKADEVKLAKLTKIVAILSKLAPLDKKISPKTVELSSAKDAEIIKKFLERHGLK